MSKKVFISMPMKGRTSDAIKSSLEELKLDIAANMPGKIEFIDTIVKEPVPDGVNVSLWYAAKSLEKLAQADILVVPDYRDQFVGCQLELLAAKGYKLKVIEYCSTQICPDLCKIQIYTPEDKSIVGKPASALIGLKESINAKLSSTLLFDKNLSDGRILANALESAYNDNTFEPWCGSIAYIERPGTEQPTAYYFLEPNDIWMPVDWETVRKHIR